MAAKPIMPAKRSAVFDHYDIPHAMAEESFTVKCKHCGSMMKGPGKATTNLPNHLKKRPLVVQRHSAKQQMDGNTIRVRLVAGRPLEQLGIKLVESNNVPRVTVGELSANSPVQRSGLIFPGDYILKIDDVDVADKTRMEVQSMIESVPEGTAVSLVLRGPEGHSSYLRTVFNDDGTPSTVRVTVPHAASNGAANLHDRSDSSHDTDQHVLFSLSGEANNNQVKSVGVKSPQPSPKRIHRKVQNLIDESVLTDTLHRKGLPTTQCSANLCYGSLMAVAPSRPPGTVRPKEELIDQARDFFEQYYTNVKRLNSEAHHKRYTEVMDSVEATGTYDLTSSELTFAAKTAWRNAPRCIGRIQWSKLQVFDARNIRTARGMFEAMCNHIKYATNKGNIRSAITIFPHRVDDQHDYRVWNSQFIKYAGFSEPDGTIIGDPAGVEFAEVCIGLGWKPKRINFEVLPLVLQANGEDPEMFDIPPELILEVNLKHPTYEWFEELGLKWYAVPGVSNMSLDAGGLEFTATPFSGWYMGTEIGARDLCDVQRYNITEKVGKLMGLETSNNSSLWKDKVLVEVNIAVLYSFQSAGVTISDHHSASESFMKFFSDEQRLRGGCPGDWVWIVPPMSGSLCPVFHQEMYKYSLKPSYEYMTSPWKTYVFKKDRENRKSSGGPRRKIGFKELARAVKFSAKLMGQALARRIKCTILYATETGKSETFAKRLCEIFKHAFDAKVLCMQDYNIEELEHETIVLVVTSTFGNGDPPDNGENFGKALFAMLQSRETSNENRNSLLKMESLEITSPKPKVSENQGYMDSIEQGTSQLANVRFSVFALGSRAYPNFCEFGHLIDNLFSKLGAEKIYSLAEGDDLCGQEQAFQTWANSVFQAACDTFCLQDDVNMEEATNILAKTDLSWAPGKFRLSPVTGSKLPPITQRLSKMHNKAIYECKMISRNNLQAKGSNRETILVKMNTQDTAELQSYLPGDHVGIFPGNRAEIVNGILKRLHNAPDADEIVQLEILKEKNAFSGSTKTWMADDRFPPCSLREAFTRFLDITTPPSPVLLQQLAGFAADEADQKRLKKLSSDTHLYDEWKFYNSPNMAEVLEQFPSLSVSPTMLLTQLSLLQARFYSISSSPAAVPDEIHATVAVVNYRTQEGKGTLHHGVCSTWLNEIKVGDKIPCFVRSAHNFHLPDDKTMPIIMVGPGTGIAPFRGFWQQRTVDMDILSAPKNEKRSGWGPMTLYFGCRNSKQDNLHAAETQKAKRDGVLTNVYTALSREPGQPKTYVQDLLMKNGQDVYNQIFNEEGHFYVCGDVAMADDVCAKLEVILCNYGNMTAEAAKQYIFKMREQKRFHEDIFGITLRTSEVHGIKRDEARKVWNEKASSVDSS